MRIAVAFFVSFFIGGFPGIAQSFEMEASINKVAEDGFYSILLTPEITTHLKQSFSDIRIYDAENNEIPYLLKHERPYISTETFHNYEIVENNKIPGCCTRLVIRNADKSKIDNIGLVIKNADVRKIAQLSGSDNKEDWYIIKDNYELESLFNNHETEEVKILYFPLSDYEYYRLDINDSLSLPIRVLKAGYFDTSFAKVNYLELPSPVLQQTDSIDKKSYIRIAFQFPQYVDQIKLNVTGPEYYLRNTQLFTRTFNKQKPVFNNIASFELRSNRSNIFHLDHIFVKELFLIIDNKDNPPLAIQSAELFQVARTLIADLQKDKTYVIRFGDKNTPLPQYDLKYFSDRLTAHPKAIEIKAVTKIPKVENIQEEFFNTKLWIWAAIIGMVALLGYFSRKMIQDIK